MAERLGHVVCSHAEDLWVSLAETRGEAVIDLQLYSHLRPNEKTPMPHGQALRIPAGVLPVLVRVLKEAQDRLIQRGTIYIPPATAMTSMERGERRSIALPSRSRGSEARRNPRAPLAVPVECRLLESDNFWPARPVSGETRDVSVGGVQVWLPKKLPRFKQVDVMMVVEGMLFRGRAEIVGADMEVQKDPKTGYFRHSLRWTSMEGPAKAALEKVIPTDGEPQANR